MDLAFTPEELAFREEIRAWVKANLPADISQKVHSAMRLTRDDLQRWAKILGKKGWLGWGWPQQLQVRQAVRRFHGLLTSLAFQMPRLTGLQRP